MEKGYSYFIDDVINEMLHELGNANNPGSAWCNITAVDLGKTRYNAENYVLYRLTSRKISIYEADNSTVTEFLKTLKDTEQRQFYCIGDGIALGYNLWMQSKGSV